MERADIERIVRAVVAQAREASAPACSDSFRVPVETSARHVHLSKEHALRLFGADALEKERDLSQPGQFVAARRVRLIGPRGVLDGVAVLGPVRGRTQVELSRTDARLLGVDAPLRLSGDLAGAAALHIQAGGAIVEASAAIVAKRHLHLTPADARRMGLGDGQTVSARILGGRPLVLEDIAVRVSDRAATALHIDTDEANASGADKDTACVLLARGQPPAEPAAPPEPSPALHGFEGKLMTEADARRLVTSGARRVLLKRGQLVTPLALDALRAGGVTVEREETT